jgi:probable rRNA maturation factor
MKIYWDETPDENYRATVEQALITGALYLGIDNHCEISVCFVSPEKIRALNNQYRELDNETDVLSFPGFAGNSALGDIVICPEVAKHQAKEYGHTFEREMAFLAVHGLLHLTGYDHNTPEDETKMCAAQSEILTKTGVER